MIKAVLFDIDNTLLDFDAYVQETMRAGFDKFKLGNYDESMFKVFSRINNSLWREIESGSLSYETLLKIRWNKIFSELNISFDGEEFEKYFRAALFDSAIHIEGATEILEYLNGRYILGVASNGPYEQQINRLIRGNMHHYFSHYFISEKIGYSKPSKEFFNHCLGALKLPPSEILMIGDTLSSDMAGAIASGFKSCFFDKYASGKAKDFKIDYEITSLDEIKKFL